MKIASVCMKTFQDPAKNYAAIEAYVKEAHKQGVQLVVFPEGALHGYPDDMRIVDEAQMKYLNDVAEVCEGSEKGVYVKKVMQLAKDNNLYIAVGITERNKDYYDIIYNTMILVGPEGYCGNYRKVQPYDEINVYYCGNKYNVYDTSIGKIGLAICYDLAFPEAERDMALQGADIIAAGVQWGYTIPDGDHTEENDLAYSHYTTFAKSRAAENGVFLAVSNATTDNHTICGHSRIIAPTGKILEDTGDGNEGMVIADVGDIKKEISYTRNIKFYTLNMMRERHPEAFKTLFSGIKYGEFKKEE